jgi:hypothetical protein
MKRIPRNISDKKGEVIANHSAGLPENDVAG